MLEEFTTHQPEPALENPPELEVEQEEVHTP